MFEHNLRQKLYRFDCPTLDALRDYYLGDVSAEARQLIERHLPGCPLCSAELAELTRFDETSTVATSPRPAAWHERLQVVVARLFTPQSEAMPALRGTTREVLLFDLDDSLTLSLNIEANPTGTYSLFGQVLSPTVIVFDRAPVRIRSSLGQVFQNNLDTLGTFVLADLSIGQYQLSITLADRHFVVPDVIIQP